MLRISKEREKRIVFQGKCFIIKEKFLSARSVWLQKDTKEYKKRSVNKKEYKNGRVYFKLLFYGGYAKEVF